MSAAVTALLCPDCPPAREAREMFFELDLARNALLMLAPLFVLVALVALIVRAVSARPNAGAPHANDVD